MSIDCVGEGAPSLVFVHGGGCDRHDWSAQVRALSSQVKVVAFDLPGHGDSEPPTTPSIEALAHTVCVIKSRYAAGQAVLVGHGMGCRIVLDAYRQSSAGIAGLVLVEGSRLAEGDADRAVCAVKQILWSVGIDKFVRTAFRKMFVPGSDPLLRRRILSLAEAWDRALAQELLLSMARWDAAQAPWVLASVRVPLLVIQSTSLQGAHVQNFGSRVLEARPTTPWMMTVTQQCPHAEIHLVSGVGHFVHIEAADIVNQYIARFAARLRESPNDDR